ncbi:BTB domain-containing protein [Favolaschia claudopus]|uniref:BTB domain-containing protein n=1 Tax=Favolaschia claudopus TaxID=2862362 RepID=A0AAV9ZTG9_9AGAR
MSTANFLSQTTSLRRRSTQNALKIVEDLWFPEADLILRADDAIFCVYGGFLGTRSSVFRDMISFPQPTTSTQTEGEMMNGRAVVRLHDSATETTSFLRAVFDSSFFMPPPSPVKFEDIIGVLRLAHKYDVSYLFRRALSRLDVLYPTNLAKRVQYRSQTHIQFPSSDAMIDMISLKAACEVGATWMLPTVYYAIAQVDDLLDHAPDYLETHQIQACLASQSKLMRAHASSYRFLRYLPLVGCSSAYHCRRTVEGAYEELEFRSERFRDMDPLGMSVFSYRDCDDLCPECHKFNAAKLSEAQQVFWKNLPALFVLPKWDELKEMRRRAMEDTT